LEGLINPHPPLDSCPDIVGSVERGSDSLNMHSVSIGVEVRKMKFPTWKKSRTKKNENLEREVDALHGEVMRMRVKQEKLENSLREFRDRLSQRTGVPAYEIFDLE